MKYQYYEIWARRPDGSEQGARISYPPDITNDGLAEMIQIVKQFIGGETNWLNVGTKFRVYWLGSDREINPSLPEAERTALEAKE